MKKKIEKWVDEPMAVTVKFYDFQHTGVQDILSALSSIRKDIESGASGAQVEIREKLICEWHRKFEETEKPTPPQNYLMRESEDLSQAKRVPGRGK